MTTSFAHTVDVVAELQELEARWLRALSERDAAELGPLLANELTNVHVSGKTEDKAAVLAGLVSGPLTGRRIEFESTESTVRLYGDVAVVFKRGVLRIEDGDPINHVGPHVWVKRGGRGSCWYHW
jgi:hypothetical protein